MPQVNISINGRDYLLNCGEQEQERLRKVTVYLSGQIKRLDRVTKQSGDTNLMLTAALLASDEVLELREQIRILQHDVNQAQSAEREAQKRMDQSEINFSAAFEKLAARIDSLAEKMLEEGADEQPAFTARNVAGAG